MKKGTHHHIRKWVHSTPRAPLKNLIFSEAVDLSPVRDIVGRREIVSCVFDDDVVWEDPRIAEKPSENLPIQVALVFKACIFKKPINWAEYYFTRPIEFFSCHFDQYVDFTGSCFHGASFEYCTFHQKVYFEAAAFLSVEENAPSCCDKPCPSLAAVSQAGHGSNSPRPMHCANFRTTTFKNGVEFDWVRFDVPACFYKTEFHGATTFLQSGFGVLAAHLSEPRPIDLNFSYTEIFGSVEFHQGLRRIAHLPLSGVIQEDAVQGPLRYKDFPPKIRLPEKGEISGEEIRADMRYVHVHTAHGLRLHSENLEECLVLGTNLEACHFTNVRWPMVDSYFPLQFKTSWTLVKHIWGRLPQPGIEVVWWAGYGNARDLFCIILIGPFHLVQSFIATAMRVMFRWMVRHDKPGNRSSSSQANPSVSSAGVLRNVWRRLAAWLKARLGALVRALSEYLVSCASHEQHGIFDHKEQIRKQEPPFSSNAQSGNFTHQENSNRPLDLYRTIKDWRNEWTKLSRAYRDLKAAYEGNHDYIYASDFHFAEKELRRINHEVPRHTRFQLQLYWLVSGYGERVLRPIWWFLAIWLLGALPYYLWGTPPENQRISISVQTTAKTNCEPQPRQCDRATKPEGSEGGVSRPEQAVESSP